MIGNLGAHGISCSEAQKRSIAASVATCILSQIHRTYPCYSSQVLMGPHEIELPEQRFFVFNGSFDWHSCVHSHWSLVQMIANGLLEPGLEAACIKALNESFTQQNCQKEAESWERLPAHEELPYGLTWFLMLDSALRHPRIEAEFPMWRQNLEPMLKVLEPRVYAWIQSLHLPVRSGVHSDSAWSLALAWDWALSVRNNRYLAALKEKAQELFLQDKNAPCDYEPSGLTFTSPILNEAAFMARALEPGSFSAWIEGFLPKLFSTDPAGQDNASAPLLPPVKTVWNGSDYYGVHEVALPLSRSLAARDAAFAIRNSAAQGALLAQASAWQAEGLSQITFEGYLADHWVGSFVIAAIL